MESWRRERLSGLWSGYHACIGLLPGDGKSAPLPGLIGTLVSGVLDTLHMPRQSGIPTNCNAWHLVLPAEDCGKVADKEQISIEDFHKWNPSVGGDACTSLWLNNYACVGVGPTPTPKDPPTPPVDGSSGARPTDNSPVFTPSPIQPKMTKECANFVYVKKDDKCDDIAQASHITLDNFIVWNPDVGGKDCKGLWSGTFACISITNKVNSKRHVDEVGPESATVVTPTSVSNEAGVVANPSPVQMNMVDGCTGFYMVKRDDKCDSIATNNKISLDDFYKWNLAVGLNCESLWVDTNCCVAAGGGSSPATEATSQPSMISTPTESPATDPSTPENASGVITPTPIQAGMVTNCAKFYLVKAKNTCGKIATDNGISLADFLIWNPAAGMKCDKLWAETNCCIGVTSGSSPNTGNTPPPPATTTAFITASDTIETTTAVHESPIVTPPANESPAATTPPATATDHNLHY